MVVIAIFKATTSKSKKQNPNVPPETLDSDPDAMEPTFAPQQRKPNFPNIQQHKPFVRPKNMPKPKPFVAPKPVAQKPIKPQNAETPKVEPQPVIEHEATEITQPVKTLDEPKPQLSLDDVRKAVVLSAILERPKF